MHYWNRDNFEGLLDLANALEGKGQDFNLLSDYCRNRERGLRKQAFESLQQFLEISNSWSDYDARDRCQTILELQSLVPGIHQFLSQPLVSGFVDPVLEKWLTDEPENHHALRWLGLLHGESDFLFKALEISPDDNPVRSRLIAMHIDEVDYATHHLDESHFIGDLEDAMRALETASQLLEAAVGCFPAKQFADEIDEYQQMLTDWKEYVSAPAGTFPDWCASRGRSYSWPIKVYYDGG